jgi:hypothetical protein
VVNAWVSPTAPGPNADTRKLDTGEGELTLAVKATSVGAGRWRYDYALMNHDYDNGITSFSIPLPAGAVVTNTYFHDVDRIAATDWVPVIGPSSIRFQPKPSAGTPEQNFQDWGLLYTFSFEVNSPPTPAAGSTAILGSLMGPNRGLPIAILGPVK